MKIKAKDRFFFRLGLCLLFLAVIVPTLMVLSPFLVLHASQSDVITRIFPNLCPAAFALPEGVQPYDCLRANLPGGLGLELSADLSREQFNEFVDALQRSQMRRFGDLALVERGAGSMYYTEAYTDAFVRVEWLNGVANYRASDLPLR